MPRVARNLALPLLVALVAGCEKPAAETPAVGGATGEALSAATSPDQPAAEVQVVAVTPEELKAKIAENKGKAVLVDFWATWCLPCRKEYPHTVELSKKHAENLVVFSVSMDEPDEEGVKTFLAKHADGKVITLRSASGGDEEAYAGFEIAGGALPHYKVYGRDGQVVETFGGDVDVTVEPEQIDAAVAKAIGG